MHLNGCDMVGWIFYVLTRGRELTGDEGHTHLHLSPSDYMLSTLNIYDIMASYAPFFLLFTAVSIPAGAVSVTSQPLYIIKGVKGDISHLLSVQTSIFNQFRALCV